jgi:cyclic beta-1,2-glucan synthetase
MYRAGLEWILGCRIRGTTLLLDPCVPKAWKTFEVKLRHRGTRYDIAFENPRGVSKGLVTLQLDGAELPAQRGEVPLVDDGATHRIRAVLG